MKVEMDESCLHLRAETQRDAYLVGCIYQAAKEAGMDCASNNDRELGGDYVVLGLHPRPEKKKT